MIDSVVVLGCGSIGLPIAVAFATTGLPVLGVDVDLDRLARIATLSETISDTGLETAFAEAVYNGTLRFDSTPAAQVRDAGCCCFLIAVATPWIPGSSTADTSGHFDRSALDAALGSALAVARHGDVICVRSTVPVGTTRQMAALVRSRVTGVEVVSTPDRSIEGNSFLDQFRIPHLLGTECQRTAVRVKQLFARLGPVVVCRTAEEAETAKLLCNVTRDAIFGLANEVAGICEGLGVDFYAVRDAASKGYPRFTLPRPGPVGGPCLSKDVRLLLGSDGAPHSPMLEAARTANAAIPREVAEVILKHLSQSPSVTDPQTVCVLGVAFKGRPAVADIRGSAAVEIVRQLRQEDKAVEIKLWDPVLRTAALEEIGYGTTVADDPFSAVTGASVILLANDHPALGLLDIERLLAAAALGALIYDLCGVTRNTSPAKTDAMRQAGELQVLGCGQRTDQLAHRGLLKESTSV